jgi:ABC-type dipeptide/oligopeptide/nickel transport system permease component
MEKNAHQLQSKDLLANNGDGNGIRRALRTCLQLLLPSTPSAIKLSIFSLLPQFPISLEINKGTLAEQKAIEEQLSELEAQLGLEASQSGIWSQYMEQYGALAVEAENQALEESGEELPTFKFPVK